MFIGVWMPFKLQESILQFNRSQNNIQLQIAKFKHGFFSSQALIQLSPKHSSIKKLPTPQSASFPINYHVTIFHGPLILFKKALNHQHWFFSPFIATYFVKQHGVETKGVIQPRFTQDILLTAHTKTAEIQLKNTHLYIVNMKQEEHLSSALQITQAHGSIDNITLETPHLHLSGKLLNYNTDFFHTPNKLNSLKFKLLKIQNKINNKTWQVKNSVLHTNRTIQNNQEQVRLNAQLKQLMIQAPNNDVFSAQTIHTNFNTQMSKQAWQQIKKNSLHWLHAQIVTDKPLPYTMHKVLSVLITEGNQTQFNFSIEPSSNKKDSIHFKIHMPAANTGVLNTLMKTKIQLVFNLSKDLINLLARNSEQKIINALITKQFIIEKNKSLSTSLVYKKGAFIINNKFYNYFQFIDIMKKSYAAYLQNNTNSSSTMPNNSND